MFTRCKSADSVADDIAQVPVHSALDADRVAGCRVTTVLPSHHSVDQVRLNIHNSVAEEVIQVSAEPPLPAAGAATRLPDCSTCTPREDNEDSREVGGETTTILRRREVLFLELNESQSGYFDFTHCLLYRNCDQRHDLFRG